MNILMCVYPYPFLKAQGQSLRIYNIAKNLANKHDLFLLGIEDSLFYPDKLIFNTQNIFKEIFTIKIKRNKLIEAFNIFSPKFFTNLEFLTTKRNMHRFISQVINNQKIDILHVNSKPPISILLTDLKKTPKLIDLCDSSCLYYKRELRKTSRILDKIQVYFKYIWSKSIERYLIKHYEMVTFVSHIDAQFSAKLEKGTIEVVYNGVDVEYFKPIPSIKEEFPSIIFFGSMTFKPNIDAVLYFYNEIFPRIRKVFENIHFYIVGRTPPKEIIKLGEKDNNVIVTGTVDDVRPFIMKANVVIVPMRMGSGMKNKVLEAMALSKPIVCTSLAIESLDNICKEAVLIGNTPEDFANKVISLLKEPKKRKKLGCRGREIVKEIYRWDKSAEKYCELYEKLRRNFNHTKKMLRDE